jgi:hypothetical protein
VTEWSRDRLCSDSGEEDVGVRQLAVVQASVGLRGDVGRLKHGRKEMEATRRRSSPTGGHGGQEKKLRTAEAELWRGDGLLYRLVRRGEGVTTVVNRGVAAWAWHGRKGVATCSGERPMVPGGGAIRWVESAAWHRPGHS